MCECCMCVEKQSSLFERHNNGEEELLEMNGKNTEGRTTELDKNEEESEGEKIK